jgi:valyl-tRNA synthetase
MAVPGTDIPFSTDRMKGYSAFANKVWNAARFVLMNLRETDSPAEPDDIDSMLRATDASVPIEDLWILHRLNRVADETSEALDKFRFHDASSLIYQFIWHELCDWYIELVKPVLTDRSAPEQERNRRVRVLIHVMDYALRILHPFMPFITEEIWQNIPHKGESIMIQDFPRPREIRNQPEAAQDMEDLMEIISRLRSARSEMTIDPKRALDAILVISDPRAREVIQQNSTKIRSLARLNSIEFARGLSGDRVLLKGIWRLGEFGLDLKGVIDYRAERERMEKERGHVQTEIDKLLKKINSHEFMARAPEEVVEETRARHSELLQRFERLRGILSQLPE